LPSGPTLFLSDLHLTAEGPAILDRLLRFLDGPAREAKDLYILGDLFDVWIGDDDQRPPIPQVAAALLALRRQGVGLFLLHGNRDFLLGDGFCRRSGGTLLADPSLIQLAGQPTLLMHGDLLCSDDLQYQQARRHLRNPAVIADFLGRPLEERATLAALYRRQSGEATSLKAEAIMDANPQTVLDFLRRHGARRLIHGHTHRAACHHLMLDGAAAQRIVLPDWREDAGGYLRVEEDGRWQVEAW
jgi:UDP-2,3-diacylglucosamine hydrolase